MIAAIACSLGNVLSRDGRLRSDLTAVPALTVEHRAIGIDHQSRVRDNQRHPRRGLKELGLMPSSVWCPRNFVSPELCPRNFTPPKR